MLKNKADQKYKKKSISLIVQNDIESAIKLANEYINSNIGDAHMIFSDKLADLKDWEKNLSMLTPSLNNEESKQFIYFYKTVSQIVEIQKRDQMLLDKSLGNMVYRGNIGMHIPGRIGLQDEFYKLVKSLVEIDVSGLIKKLENI